MIPEESVYWAAHLDKGYGQVTKLPEGSYIYQETGAPVPIDVIVHRGNPSRFQGIDDNADLPELSEPTVLMNLLERYKRDFVYTNSGLFLVAINPYRELPAYYGEECIESYVQGTNQAPHIYQIVDKAYKALLQEHQNQSILITGESGAGKTENTKRAIQYLTHQSLKTKQHQNSLLEAQILAANPLLEAFGNGQTVRNNNSSRFGKFVRIEIDPKDGQIRGARIEKYLLEKSRVVKRSPGERSFHIFYQMIANEGFSSDEFRYLCQSSINATDKKDFEQVIFAFKTLGISDYERILQVVKAILYLGNLEFEPSSDEDQAQLKSSSKPILSKVCEMLQVDEQEFLSALLNPVLKAGKEVISQARDVSQVEYSVDALARTFYERLFSHLVDRINQAINPQDHEPAESTTRYIGVLDIAGFEIFENNSFEQLCVNYTNEKLQQLFNHCMFVREQEDYKREGLKWDFVDFGADLQPTIDLIERCNPVGILACLDEDCVVPKATDTSFTQKLCALWKAKNPKFEGDKFGDGFILHHYAGKVEYKTSGWLDKNKDPMNESVITVLSKSTDELVRGLLVTTEGNSRIVKRGVFRTVAQRHKESLTLLMAQLNATQPHFVRCIIPNERKEPRAPNGALILQQLRCNGVLEGIRICRQGFPTRVTLNDFINNYRCLAKTLNPKLSVEEVIQAIMNASGIVDYQIGSTRVFLRAGQLSQLDDLRAKLVTEAVKTIQDHLKVGLAVRLNAKAQAISAIQSSWCQHLNYVHGGWRTELLKLLPTLQQHQNHKKQQQEINSLKSELQSERERLLEIEHSRREFERRLATLEHQLSEANETKASLVERRMTMEVELVRLREKISLEYEPRISELSEQLESTLKEKEEQAEGVDQLIQLLKEQKAKLEGVEFERIRLENLETCSKEKLTEMEKALEEQKQLNKQVIQRHEDTLKQLKGEHSQAIEELERSLQEMASQSTKITQKYEQEVNNKQRQEEQERKKLQRDLQEALIDKEALERRVQSLEETVKRYESGADNLANQLIIEAEMKNQSVWRREKEKLELQLEESGRNERSLNDKIQDLQSQLTNNTLQITQLKNLVESLELEKESVEGERKQEKKRLSALELNERENEEKLGNLGRQVEQSKQGMKQYLDRLNVLNDDYAALEAQLRASQHLHRLAQIQADDTKERLLQVTTERNSLETKLRELQLQMLNNSESQSSGSIVNLSNAYQQLAEQIQREAEERQATVRENKRLERSVRELQEQIADGEQLRITLEERITKLELQVRSNAPNFCKV